MRGRVHTADTFIVQQRRCVIAEGRALAGVIGCQLTSRQCVELLIIGAPELVSYLLCGTHEAERSGLATSKLSAKCCAKHQEGRVTRMALTKTNDLEGHVPRMVLKRTTRPERRDGDLAETNIPYKRHERHKRCEWSGGGVRRLTRVSLSTR